MYTLKTINKKISEIIDRIDSAKSNNNDRRIIEAINDLEEAEDVKESIIIIQELNQNKINMKEKKIPISFRFDKEILDKVKIKAEKENRSINNTVETILKQSLK